MEEECAEASYYEDAASTGDLEYSKVPILPRGRQEMIRRRDRSGEHIRHCTICGYKATVSYENPQRPYTGVCHAFMMDDE